MSTAEDAHALGRVTIADLTEEDLLAAFAPLLPPSRNELVGTGDDCAVLVAPDSRYCVSTDILVQGRHFSTDWSSAWDIGARAAGLALLSNGIDDPDRAGSRVVSSSWEGFDEVMRAAVRESLSVFRAPVPPLKAGPALAEAGATAMMDVSDGLLRDAGRMAAASEVRIDLAERRRGGPGRSGACGGTDGGFADRCPSAGAPVGADRGRGPWHARRLPDRGGDRTSHGLPCHWAGARAE